MYPDSSNANGRLMVTSPKLYPEYKNSRDHDHPLIQHPQPIRGYNIVDCPVLNDDDKASLQDKPVHSFFRTRWRQRQTMDTICQCCIQ